MHQSRFAIWAGLVAVFGFGSVVAASDNIPQVGQQAPDFTLSSQDGSPVSLRDFRGRWIVLYFYPKDNTPGCTIEAHNFQRDLSKYEQHHAIILGVSVDSTDSHKEFCGKQGLTFKLLADSDKKVAQQYGSLRNLVVLRVAARNTFLVDPDGKIAKIWTGVDPNHHSSEVLATLAELQSKK